MAKASKQQWQELINPIQATSLQELQELSKKFRKQLSRYRFKGRRVSLFVLTLLAATLLWNWKLVLATGTGALVMLGAYSLQQKDWQRIAADLRRFLRGSNRKIAIAAGTGGLATFSTYMAVSIWIDSENHWMATGLILQGVGTIATLTLLSWQLLNQQTSPDEASLNELLMHLTDADSLKRLIAVRQLAGLVGQHKCEQHQERAIADYFRLMLERETSIAVREALLESLQAIQNPKQLPKGEPPFSVGWKQERTTTKARHRIYDYE